jgi:hypothetical protein
MSRNLLTTEFGILFQQLTLGIIEFRWHSNYHSRAQITTTTRSSTLA